MNILSYVIFLNKLLLILSTSKIIPGRFWHISDVFWKSSIESCGNQTVESCATELLKSILNLSGRITPDFIFWTCAGGRYIESVSNAFKAAADNILVLPSLPRATDEYSFTNYTVLSNYFSSWLDEKALRTFRKYGYYSITTKIPKDLKIIVLNSGLFCIPNSSSVATNPRDQWNWLFLELSNARKNHLKVYILTSVAPGITTTIAEKQFTAEENLHYIEMVRMYSDIIKGQFAGYENGNKFQIFTNETGSSCNWLMLAPRFSAHARLYMYSKNTLEPLDYIQFYKSNDRWFKEHIFTNYFLLPNISTFSLDLLVGRMKSSKDFLDKYIITSYQVEEQSYSLCKITAVDYNEYDTCMKRTKNPIRTTPSPHGNDCTTTYNNYFTARVIFVLFLLL